MKMRIAMLVAAAGLAAPALAQDSVSINSNGGNGLPGDALGHLDTAVQRTAYVVDLSEITTSWGTKFRIGPIMKSNKTADATDAFFGFLWSGHSISQTMKTNVPFPSASYLSWSTPGGGVNPTQNSGGTPTSSVNFSTQFAIGGYETSTERANPLLSTETRLAKSIVSAVCNFDVEFPNRMYVTRVHAADNVRPFNGGLVVPENSERASFGYGSIDLDGNTYFRADNNLVPATVTNRILGNNIFRVKALSRNAAVLNDISNLGGADAAATDRIVNQDASTFTCPNNIPADLATGTTAGDGRYFGLKFQNAAGADLTNYAAEEGLGGSATKHLSCPSPQDTRGNASFSQTVLFPGTVGTSGFVLRDTGSGAENAFTLQLHGVNSNGLLSNKTDLRRPAALLVDNSTGYSWPETAFGSVFRHYQGITAFNGGVQVAVGKESSGLAVTAAVLYNDAGAAAYNAGNPMNAMAVCRFNPANPTATATWALAGWCESILVSGILVNTGKPILNGAGGSAIGRMCSLAEVTNFAVPFGPSMSAPVFDSKGNIWFLCAAELYNRGPAGESDFDTVLVRGVYNASNFSYDLELVLEQGTTIAGQNSALNYRITFLELAYVGTGSSANGNFSPGSLGASSATQAAWNNMDPASLTQSESRTLGGLVLQAKIVYDVGDENGVDGPDGFFDDPTGTAPTYPNSRDEAYRAILYITGDNPTTPPCLADFNGDTVVDFFDYLDFVDAFSANDPSADFNGDTVIDFFDYLDFVDAFSTGC